MNDGCITRGKTARQPRKPRVPRQRRERGRSGKVSLTAQVFIAADENWLHVGVSCDPGSRVAAINARGRRSLSLTAVGPLSARAAAFYVKRSICSALSACRVTGDWFNCPVETAMEALRCAQVRQ